MKVPTSNQPHGLRRWLALPCLWMAAAIASAQTATELARFPPNAIATYSNLPGVAPRPEYSMCVGHTDPNTGDEFAVAGADNGVIFVHVPQPRSSQDLLTNTTFETWFFAESPTSRWRGVASFDSLVYSVQPFRAGIRRFRIDATAMGAQKVVDLGISNATQLSAGYQRLEVDRTNGHLYVCGRDTTLGRDVLCIYDVYDEAAEALIDPPLLLAVWDPGGTVVDSHVSGDRIFVAHHRTTDPRWWQILDRSALPPYPTNPYTWSPPWGEWRNTVPGGSQLSHDGYVSPDGSTWYTVTEGFGFMTARDISGLPPLTTAGTALPEPPILGSYHNNSSVPIHAIEGLGLTGFVSHWSLGLHVLDLSAHPGTLGVDYPRVAGFGTSAMATTFVGDGAWDCDPHQDSGLVYVSDSEEGLFVLRLEQAGINRYGPGKPNALGVPRLVAQHGPPRVGRNFVLTGTGLQTGTGSIFALSFGEEPGYLAGVPLVVQGVTILVDPATAMSWFYFTDGQGQFRHTLPIPNIPAFLGARLFTQAVELLPSGGLASTRGSWMGIAN